MYRTYGANFAYQPSTYCMLHSHCNFTHFQFTFNIVWDKPINHLAWKGEQYQLIHVTNQKHIIFVVFVFTGILNLKILWVVFVLNLFPSSFQNLMFQGSLYLSSQLISDAICVHTFRAPSQKAGSLRTAREGKLQLDSPKGESSRMETNQDEEE